jgi:hypothetical protein
MRSNNEEARGYPLDDEDNRRVLMSCSDDMVSLWEDPEVQRILNAQEVMVQDQSGLYVALVYILTATLTVSISFLDSIKRITKIDYLPTSSPYIILIYLLNLTQSCF